MKVDREHGRRGNVVEEDKGRAGDVLIVVRHPCIGVDDATVEDVVGARVGRERAQALFDRGAQEGGGEVGGQGLAFDGDQATHDVRVRLVDGLANTERLGALARTWERRRCADEKERGVEGAQDVFCLAVGVREAQASAVDLGDDEGAEKVLDEVL